MLMISVGHRTGLFDAMDEMSWSTSEQIANAASLDERYVREWLGAMVTGRIVEYQAADRRYKLPKEHARWLTRSASPENLAVTSQWLGVLGCVESKVVDKFKTGGGVHYDCFERFHETMAEESGQTVVAALHDHILPLSAYRYSKAAFRTNSMISNPRPRTKGGTKSSFFPGSVAKKVSPSRPFFVSFPPSIDFSDPIAWTCRPHLLRA